MLSTCHDVADAATRAGCCRREHAFFVIAPPNSVEQVACHCLVFEVPTRATTPRTIRRDVCQGVGVGVGVGVVSWRSFSIETT